jgi:antitoxin YefM
MVYETTFTNAQASLAKLCNRAVSTREHVIIHRRNAEDVALVSVSELKGLIETVHLFRSPKNAQRLFSALNRVRECNCTVYS